MDDRPPDEASGDVVYRPQLAHIREEYQSDEELLEATELRPVSCDVKDSRLSLSRVLSPGRPRIHWYDPVKKFWRHNIRISVPHEDCRDHLGK